MREFPSATACVRPLCMFARSARTRCSRSAMAASFRAISSRADCSKYPICLFNSRLSEVKTVFRRVAQELNVPRRARGKWGTVWISRDRERSAETSFSASGRIIERSVPEFSSNPSSASKFPFSENRENHGTSLWFGQPESLQANLVWSLQNPNFRAGGPRRPKRPNLKIRQHSP